MFCNFSVQYKQFTAIERKKYLQIAVSACNVRKIKVLFLILF